MAAQTVVLITGAKAGIGKTFLRNYAARDNTIVIAAIRDGPDSAKGKELASLPTGDNSKVIVVKYDASSNASTREMVKTLQSSHSIASLDTVVANAGVLKQFGPVRTVSESDIKDTFDVNVMGVIQLYQATIPLLDKSQDPKFFIISSSLGSIELMDDYAPMQMIAYNMSKSADNALAARIHREEERLVVCPVHPGWIATDMGSKAAVWNGMNENDPPVDLEESVAGLMKLFDKATKKEHSGKFWDYNSEPVPW